MAVSWRYFDVFWRYFGDILILVCSILAISWRHGGGIVAVSW